jgi:hypothetical protein
MKILTLTCFAATLLGRAVSQSITVGIYSQETVIPWHPKVAASVDQSVLLNGSYYLLDRTNGGVRNPETDGLG